MPSLPLRSTSEDDEDVSSEADMATSGNREEEEEGRDARGTGTSCREATSRSHPRLPIHFLRLTTTRRSKGRVHLRSKHWLRINQPHCRTFGRRL